MKRFGWLLGGLGVALVVWFAAGELPWAARLWCATLLGPATVGFFYQAANLETLPAPLPRIPVYLGTIIGLTVLGCVSVLAAYSSHFPARSLGLYLIDARAFGLWFAFVVLAATAVTLAFKGIGFRDSRIMQEITPVTVGEKLVFVGVSLSAGIFEEVTFRSFLIPALVVASGSRVWAVLLSCAAFGLMHAHQQAGGALRAAVLGLVLAVPFVLTGSVLPGMAAHVVIDLVGGLWLARWLLR
jgi:membrane protease YdiL (CAAX protease family)